jgi:hypothetical protein
MNFIVLMELMVGDFRQRKIAAHHVELNALSYESYILNKHQTKSRVDQRFWSLHAQNVYNQII